MKITMDDLRPLMTYYSFPEPQEETRPKDKKLLFFFKNQDDFSRVNPSQHFKINSDFKKVPFICEENRLTQQVHEIYQHYIAQNHSDDNYVVIASLGNKRFEVISFGYLNPGL